MTQIDVLGYALTSVTLSPGNDGASGLLQINPGWTAAEALSFAFTDADDRLNAVEDGQMARVLDSEGTEIAAGPALLSQSATVVTEHGQTVTLYLVTVDGTWVGWVADGPLQPGNSYSYSGGSDEPLYAALVSPATDPSGPDAILGTGNADALQAGAGDDTVSGGAGDDQLQGDGGDDRLSGEAGRDILMGGAGNDRLDAGAEGDWANGEEGDDTVIGGEGDDWLTGGDGADLLEGGTGSDWLGGGAGDDTARGGDGNDWIVGDEGEDSLSGGSGDDWLSGGAGEDSLAGDDGDDWLNGNAGDDRLEGGTGADWMTGDDGDDTLAGGAGADLLSGGSGADTFVLSPDAGPDTITDFDLAPDRARTTDQLDVSALRTASGQRVGLRDVIVDSDPDGHAVLRFPMGESVRLLNVPAETLRQPGVLYSMGVPCFVAGTRVATPEGARPIEELKAGDRVVTACSPAMEVIWHGQRTILPDHLRRDPRLRPIRLSPEAFGNAEAVWLSMQHCISLPDGRGTRVLVRARHLAEFAPNLARWVDASELEAEGVSYHHLLLPRHALLCVGGGGWAESFYPGPVGIRGFDDHDALARALSALLARHPVPGKGYGPTVCPILSRRAAMRLLAGRARPRPVPGNPFVTTGG